MTLLTTEPQPRFPYDDLSTINAGALEIMLANKDVVEVNHLAAESIRRVYKIGHGSIMIAGGILDYDTQPLKAIDHGIAMFEAMSAIVNVTPGAPNVFKMSDISAGLEGKFDPAQIQRYFDDAYECFRDENPDAVHVVREAIRLPGIITEYAVMGAAVARHFELDTAA